jgi:hypothetical protein
VPFLNLELLVVCLQKGSAPDPKGKFLATPCSYLMPQAPPQEGAISGHELASVLVGSRPCTCHLKVTLAGPKLEEPWALIGHKIGLVCWLLRPFLEGECVPDPCWVLVW